MAELNVDDLCVICLMESQSYYCIYDRHILDNSLIYEVINDVCQLDITMEDESAQFICSECCTKLFEFSVFKREAQKARDAYLHMKENSQKINSSLEKNSVYMDVNFECKDAVTPSDDGCDTQQAYIKPEENSKECLMNLGNASEEWWNEPEIEEEVTKNIIRSMVNKQVELTDEREKALEISSQVCDSSLSQEEESKSNTTYPWTVKMRKLKVTAQKKYGQPSSERKGKSHLVMNMSVNSGKSPFECHICGKRFSQKKRLHIHLGIHTEEKCFECLHCGWKFAQIEYLVNHMKIHTGEKPFQCQHCGKKFSHNGTLLNHLKIHTCEKPFECQYCGMKFKQNRNLVMHLRIHSGELPFECQHCTSKFSYKGSLVKHLRTHAEEKAFECHAVPAQDILAP